MSTDFACHHLLDLHECDGTLVVVLRGLPSGDAGSLQCTICKVCRCREHQP